MDGVRRCFFASLAVVSLAGCTGSSIRNPFRSGYGPHDRTAEVLVLNSNVQDAVLHATYLGSRVRLGSVTSQSRRVLEIPAGFIGARNIVGLEVNLIGSRERFHTGDLFLGSARRIELTIQNRLSTTSWAIR